MNNSKQKRLYKVYNKQLKKLHKDNFKKITNNLEYFITYLQFLRDYYILTEDLEVGGSDNLKIATLATAIIEYEAYKDCIKKYYLVTNTEVKQIAKGTKEEILAKYNEEKASHWKYFWKIVMLHIEDWVNVDATV